MNTLTIEILNVPISVNIMYKTYRGRIILSKRGRDYKKDMVICINDELLKQNVNEIIKGSLKVDIDIYFKDKRKRDIDNYGKSLIDCMKNVLFEDDDMIYELNMKKHIGCGFDKTIITITKL